MAEKFEIVVRRPGLHFEEVIELTEGQLPNDKTVGGRVRGAVKRLLNQR